MCPTNRKRSVPRATRDIRVVTGGYGFVSVTCRAECLAHDGTYISFFSGFDQEEK